MRRRAGFTLIEVLIALAITTSIMAAVIQTLDSVRKGVDTIHNLVETENVGPRILEQLREDLSRLAVYDAADYKLLKGENDLAFGVESDRLDFVIYSESKVPFELPGQDKAVRAPLNEVGYRLRPNPNQKDFLELYRREDPLLDDRPLQGGAYTLLYDRVVSFDVTYAAQPELSPLWKDDWDSESERALPYAIKIFLQIEVQPRRSLESLGIMGANLARLDFEDIVVIPPETRWRFRNRMHPARPEVPGSGEGTPTPGTGDGTGDEELPASGPAGDRRSTNDQRPANRGEAPAGGGG